MTMVERIRAAIAAGVVVVAVGAGTVIVGPEAAELGDLRVAGFNIQVFGQTKLAKEKVMDVLVETALQLDVMVVQEVRDADRITAARFLERINDVSALTYEMVEGPRLGRSNSKEQYVIYYIPARVQLLSHTTLPDPQDVFEREPIIARFRSDDFDFTVVGCHIKPTDAKRELGHLATAARRILAAQPEEQDVILLGDFNADGTYLDETTLTNLFPTDEFTIVIDNNMVTTTKSKNTYDRIILTGGLDHEYIAGSAQPFDFADEFQLDDDQLVTDVSDHLPVFAEFRTSLGDDD